MAMNIFEQEQGLASEGWGSADHLHAGIEAMRLSFADALSLVADPEVWLNEMTVAFTTKHGTLKERPV